MTLGRPRSLQVQRVQRTGLRMIIRYRNRRYYDHGAMKYIKLDRLLYFPKGTFMVLNHANGKDITGWAFDSALHAEERTRLRAEAKKLGIK